MVDPQIDYELDEDSEHEWMVDKSFDDEIYMKFDDVEIMAGACILKNNHKYKVNMKNASKMRSVSTSSPKFAKDSDMGVVGTSDESIPSDVYLKASS